MFEIGQAITYTRTNPFTDERYATVDKIVGFNYTFDKITGVYVSGSPVVVWLDQIL